MVLRLGDQPVILQASARPIGSQNDFTVYVDARTLREELISKSHDDCRDSLRYQSWIKSAYHFDVQHGVVISLKDDQTIAGVCRLHAALCFEGGVFSVTIRSFEPDKGQSVELSTVLRPRQHYTIQDTGQCVSDQASVAGDGVADSVYLCAKLKLDWKHEEYLTSLDRVGIATSKKFDFDKPGLLLFAGQTGSGKTNLLRVSLRRALQLALRKSGRQPHVIVVGDPVETVLLSDTVKSARNVCCEGAERPIDFTPRVLGIDVASVQQAAEDALRETPAVFVVDELRRPDDIRAALTLAATGHLVIATAHSSSLRETMGKLSDSFGATTPSLRASLASRILGLVHCKKYKPGRREAVLPAIWRASPAAIHSFVSDGLSSLVFQPEHASAYCFGYLDAALHLEDEALRHLSDKGVPVGEIRAEWAKVILEAARDGYPRA